MVVERIGVGRCESTGDAALFHRGKVKLSSKNRVYPVFGDYQFFELDPSEIAAE